MLEIEFGAERLGQPDLGKIVAPDILFHLSYGGMVQVLQRSQSRVIVRGTNGELASVSQQKEK